MTVESLNRRNTSENLFLYGKDAERRGDTALALKSYTQAWQLDSSSIFLTNYASEYALRVGKPGQAIYILSGGANFAELNDSILYKIGGIYIHYKHYIEALKVYREIDSMEQSDSLIYANLLAENNIYTTAAEILDSISDGTDSILAIRTADLYRRAGNGDRAETLFRELYEKYPQNKMVKKGLGLTLLARNQEKEAMELLKWYLPITGGIPDVQVIELVGRFYASQGQFSDAVQLFQFLYKNDGSPQDYYYGRPLAIYSFLDQRYEYAKNIMEQLLKNSSEDYELHFLLGSVYEATGEYNSSFAEYSKALEINPDFEDAIRARVLLNARLNKVDEAVRLALEYTQKMPGSIDAWSLYGSLLTMGRRFEEAIIPLEKAIELSNGRPAISALFELGMSLERTGKSRDAEKVFQEILAKKPSHAPTANYLGYMWAEKGVKLDKAEELILIALKEDPENGAYLDSYGWVLYQKGDYKAAAVELEKALQSISDDYVIYYHLGMVYQKLEMYGVALENMKKASTYTNPMSDEIFKRISELEALNSSSAAENGSVQ